MKHLTLFDFSPDNQRLVVENKNYSPAKNYAVIDQVLAENDKMQTELDDKVKENAGNVADILTSFAKYKLDRGEEKKFEQWMGKSWMTRIYGDKLIEKIRMREAIQAENKRKGNSKFEDYYLI